MEKIPNAVYTRELREEAVKMITEDGLKASEVTDLTFLLLHTHDSYSKNPFLHRPLSLLLGV